MDLIKKRKKPVKIHDDGYNTIVFKPNTNKVVIGINTGSFNGAKHRSFNCKNIDKAKEIGVNYINKKSRLKIN